MDTIFAEATAPGRSGVSIIRISGPASRDAANALGAGLQEKDRRVAKLVDTEGNLVDIAFCLSFPEGESFTGEETVELQLHGSPAIVARISTLLVGYGLRLADPGEFTRRAMENGRLDLAQVEGLADLIDAETEEQRKQALRVFDGRLGAKVDDWRRDLIRAAALLEATIDFADEDVPEDVFPEVRKLISGLRSEISKEKQGISVRERVRSGFVIGIVGAPNAGKSTLLNRLAGRDAAIISERAGTTRDVIEVHMDLKGFPVTFLDTAGIRETDDEVEAIGIDRALERAQGADIRIHLVTSGEAPVIPPQEGDIVLKAKDDHGAAGQDGISGKTGHGIQPLIDRLLTVLQEQVSGAGIATRQRHAEALGQSLAHLEKVDELITSGATDACDLLADDLRQAIRALDSIVGRIDVEQLLDEIFQSFCIGK